MSDHIFLTYCVEILLNSLKNLREEKFQKRSFEPPFGLEIQQQFSSVLVDLVQPFFSDEKNIQFIIDNNGTDAYQEQDTEQSIKQSFLNELYLNKEEKFKIRLRLCYKTLKLFNLASSVYIHYETVDKIRKGIMNFNSLLLEKYLVNKSGIIIKSQIVELFRHYNIFFMNQVLTNRTFFFKDKISSSYSELEAFNDIILIDNERENSGFNFIKNILSEVTTIYFYFRTTDVLEFKPFGIYIRDFLQPCVYKYIRGCLTINVDTVKESASYFQSVTVLYNMFFNYLPKIEEILQNTVGIRKILDENIIISNFQSNINFDEAEKSKLNPIYGSEIKVAPLISKVRDRFLNKLNTGNRNENIDISKRKKKKT